MPFYPTEAEVWEALKVYIKVKITELMVVQASCQNYNHSWGLWFLLNRIASAKF